MDISRIFELYEIIKQKIPGRYSKPAIVVCDTIKELAINQTNTCRTPSYKYYGVYDPNTDTIGIPLEMVRDLSDLDVAKIILHEISHATRGNKYGFSSSQYFDEIACNIFAARWSKRLGLSATNRQFGGWTKEEEQILKAEYHLHTSKYLIERLQKSWSSISNKAWKLGLKGMGRERSKYEMNHTFFSYPLTPAAAWVAGFIAADGCMRTGTTNEIKIDISAADIEVLEKIKSLISYAGPIRRYSRYRKDYAYLSLSSRQMCKDLIQNFGITNKKSLTYMIPDKLKTHPLLHHFLRGFMDGDGSYYYEYRYKIPELRISAVGTKEFMKFVCLVFIKKCGAKAIPRLSRHGKAYGFKFGGNVLCKSIRDYLYRDATNLCLKRKFEKVFNPELIHAMDNNKKAKSIKVIDENNCEIIYPSIKEAAKVNNISVSTIYRILCSPNQIYKKRKWEYAK